jgi:deazaflavin-dependent oxidoreductase (nitroreductase family)
MADQLNGIPRVDPTKRPTGWRLGVLRLVATKPGTAFHRVCIAPLDGPVMRLSGGRVNLGFGAIPLVVLRTTGAKTGEPRDVPLGYFTDGDAVILMASSYGRTKHPGWYHNLIADSECELFADGQWRTFVAAATDGDERARLYALAEGYYSGYTTYALNTDGIRTIPVMRLTPA